MELPMTRLADGPARLRILADLDATLLVEAAAGTGKTALMAGRLTMLLARGTEPGAIAAITFTELAASVRDSLVKKVSKLRVRYRIKVFFDVDIDHPSSEYRPCAPAALDSDPI
jgi:superfamily I DNA/RNA helicase